MTTIRTIETRTRPATPSFARTAMQVIASAWAVYRNRRQLRRIADLDDHLLRDIGLTRSDVEAASTMPIYTDPTARLAITSRGEWAPTVMPRGRSGRGRAG